MPVETPKSCFIFIFNDSFWRNLAGKKKGLFQISIQVHRSDFFFWQKFAILLFLKKSPKQPLVKGTFWKFSQKITRFQGRKS